MSTYETPSGVGPASELCVTRRFGDEARYWSKNRDPRQRHAAAVKRTRLAAHACRLVVIATIGVPVCTAVDSTSGTHHVASTAQVNTSLSSSVGMDRGGLTETVDLESTLTDPNDLDTEGDGLTRGSDVDHQTTAADRYESGPCDGLSYDDIEGSAPTYGGVPAELSTFPNSDAACNAIWAPDLDVGFVPQGLALRGDDTAYVSGYIDTGSTDTNFCRLVHVDLTTGETLAGRSFGRDQCRHGGGIEIDGGGRIWIADTPGLVLLDSFNAAPLKVDLVGQQGSYLTNGAIGRLYVGDHDDDVMQEYAYSLLETAARSGRARDRKINVSQSLSRRPVPDKAQGADLQGGALWVSSSTPGCGNLSVAGSVGFGPGVEEVELDGDSLWAVFEAGASKYPARFLPLVARFDPTRIAASGACVMF
jgi:hypothetical protein